MDPISHAVLGATLGFALRGERLGRAALGVGLLAGIAPDVDNFVRSEADPLLYVEYHRGFTHSLAFAFAGALIAIVPFLFNAERRKHWRSLYFCAWAAWTSHCLLDAVTTYGTQLYWPVSTARAGWDLISIVDPIFTLALLASLFFAIRESSQGIARAGIWLALLYLGLGGLQGWRATKIQQELAAARAHRIERSEVMPTLANNFVWRSLYLANGRLYADRIRVGWFSGGTVRAGTALPLLTRDKLRPNEKAGNEQHHAFDRFAWFSGDWVARAPDDETLIGDMRYSRSTEAFDPIWAIRFQDGTPGYEWVGRERERRLQLSELWREIRGNDPRYRSLKTE
jgi:inner membrane protein